MKMSDVFPSQYLKASDFPTPRNVTVREIRVERFNDDETKPIVFFEEGKKGLVLNLTNANMLKTLSGGSDDMEDWIGVKCQIYSTKVQFQAKMVDALRLQPIPVQVQKKAKAPAAPAPVAAAPAQDAPPQFDTDAPNLDADVPF